MTYGTTAQRGPNASRTSASCSAARLVGDDERDVGVRVIDEAMRQERVQQRLDRRVGRAGVEEVGAQLVHHLLVRQRVEAAQPAEVPQVDGGKSGRLDGVEVPAAALDEERLDPVADQRRHACP